MGESEPKTQTAQISEVRRRLSRLVNEVSRSETRFLIEKAGIPVAALVSLVDLARLQRLDAQWAEGTRALERFSEAFADVPVEELEAKIDQIIAEDRARVAAARRTA